MPFRFIHTADIHLDSPLKSLAMRNEALAEVVANATRQVFVRIVDLCLTEQVHALLIAGDLYDGKQTSMKTARFLVAQLRRLDDANISVFIIRGNHDAESKITRELTFPDCVHVFSGKANSFPISPPIDADVSPFERPVIIHGVSFKKPHAPESLLPLYKQHDPNALNIGMMHTSLDGASGHDLYAPCALNDLINHGFDYWALGHIHKRKVYEEETCTVVMPGIPQGRDIGESGEKSVTLVSIDDNGLLETEEHRLALAQFEQIEVALDDVEQWSNVIDSVMEQIDRVFDSCVADHLVARVVLTGRTSLAYKIRRDEDLLLQDVTSRLEDDGHRWLDKIIIRCELPLSEQSSDTNPHQELYDLMIKEIKNSAAFTNSAVQAVKELSSLLPAELRDKFEKDEAAVLETIESLAIQGSSRVSAYLQASNADEPTYVDKPAYMDKPKTPNTGDKV